MYTKPVKLVAQINVHFEDNNIVLHSVLGPLLTLWMACLLIHSTLQYSCPISTCSHLALRKVNAMLMYYFHKYIIS